MEVDAVLGGASSTESNAQASSSKSTLPPAEGETDEKEPELKGKSARRRRQALAREDGTLKPREPRSDPAQVKDVEQKVKSRKPKQDNVVPVDGQEPVIASATAHAGKESGKKARRRRNREKEAMAQGEGQGAVHDGVWECHPLAQGNVSRIPPVWSPDGRFYITADDRSVHIHTSASPYTRLSTLSSTHAKGHTKAITALLVSPVNPNHLVTSGADGKVMVWDYVKGDLVHSVTVNPDGAVGHMCITKVGNEWVIFGTTSVLKKGKGKTMAEYQYQQRVVRLSYPTTSSPSPAKHVVGRLSAPPTALFAAPSSLYLIALAGNKAYTYLLPSSFPASSSTAGDISAEDSKAAQPQCVKFVSDHSLTCGSFAPSDKLASTSTSSSSRKSEDWFATGDERGVIRLWHGLDRAFSLLNSSSAGVRDAQQGTGAERRLPTTSLHWHAHAVAALAFTPSGSQLLSVGEESVLVQWHLASGKREYIPRLGGRPIVSLAIKEGRRGQEEEWFVALRDGGVMKVGAASGSIAPVGHGVRLDPLRNTSASNPYPLAIHPSTSSLVLPSSHPSTLQWVDPSQSSVLFDLEVVPSNRASRRDTAALEGVAVEHVAFSAAVEGRSEWMATVEGRQGDEFEGSGAVRVLKVWKWDAAAGRYVVNTTQPRPHDLKNITAVQFQKTDKEGERPLLLTTDQEGGVRTWVVRQSRKSEHGKTASRRAPTYELYWTQRSHWTYRSFPVHSAAFSRDGTIVALAHGPVVSLWDTESNTLLKALDASAAEVRELLFVGDEGRWLVGAGKGLISWDLFSCEPVWQLSNPHAHLQAHPSGFVALSTVSHQSILSLFSPSSAKPLAEHRINNQSFRTVVRLPSSNTGRTAGSLSFVGVTAAGDVVKFGDASSPLPRLTASLAGKGQESGARGIWQEMFGDRAFALHSTEASANVQQQHKVERKVQGRASAVFDGPSHTLPPVSTLFDAFIDEVLALPMVAAAGPSAGEKQSGPVDDDMEAADADQEASSIGHVDAILPVGGKKVDDNEMREMEAFFRQILTVGPAAAGGGERSLKKAKSKANLKARTVEAGVEAGAGPDAASATPVQAVAGVGKKDKKARASLGAAAGAEDEDEAREVGGTGAQGQKARKRKAPRESAA